jgi:hypothetical protein
MLKCGYTQPVRSFVSTSSPHGLPGHIHTAVRKHRTLPGYFRPCKEWDVVVICGPDLLAVVEIKSQVRSFGNNFNNRVEEALGSATDFWMSYKNGNLKPSAKPWLGYMFMLGERTSSLRPTKRIELSPFSVDERFQNLSYAQRYEIVSEWFVRCFMIRLASLRVMKRTECEDNLGSRMRS